MWEAAGRTQPFGILPLTWKTWLEFSAPSLSTEPGEDLSEEGHADGSSLALILALFLCLSNKKIKL